MFLWTNFKLIFNSLSNCIQINFVYYIGVIHHCIQHAEEKLFHIHIYYLWDLMNKEGMILTLWSMLGVWGGGGLWLWSWFDFLFCSCDLTLAMSAFLTVSMNLLPVPVVSLPTEVSSPSIQWRVFSLSSKHRLWSRLARVLS